MRSTSLGNLLSGLDTNHAVFLLLREMIEQSMYTNQREQSSSSWIGSSACEIQALK